MREIKVANASILFETSEGVKFDIEVRKESGIAVYMDDKKILDRSAGGQKIPLYEYPQ